MTTTKTTHFQTRKEKRAMLSELSRQLKKNWLDHCKKHGIDPKSPEYAKRVNDLLEIYYSKKKGTQGEWKTFSQWKNEGKKIRKGEKAFTFWSKPIKQEKTKEEKKLESQDFMSSEKEKTFFGICNLFHEGQIK